MWSPDTMTLRTVFRSVDGAPEQIIRPVEQADFGWQVLDATNWPRDRLDEAIGEVSGYAFDLSAEIPLQARLFRVAEVEYVLAGVLHHIAADGWSVAPLLTDLAVGVCQPVYRMCAGVGTATCAICRLHTLATEW